MHAEMQQSSNNNSNSTEYNPANMLGPVFNNLQPERPCSPDVTLGAYFISHLNQICENCGVTETPQWRKGWYSNVLQHTVLLCNKCGLKYMKNQFCPYCMYVYYKVRHRNWILLPMYADVWLFAGRRQEADSHPKRKLACVWFLYSLGAHRLREQIWHPATKPPSYTYVPSVITLFVSLGFCRVCYCKARQERGAKGTVLPMAPSNLHLFPLQRCRHLPQTAILLSTVLPINNSNNRNITPIIVLVVVLACSCNNNNSNNTTTPSKFLTNTDTTTTTLTTLVNHEQEWPPTPAMIWVCY